MDWLNDLAQSLAAATGLQRWALLVFGVVLAAMLLDFLQRRLMRRLEAIVSSTTNLWDDALFHAMIRPLSLLIWVVGISIAIQVIPVREEGGLLADDWVVHVRQVGILCAIAWFLASFIGNIENNIIRVAEKDGRGVDRTTVHALGRVLKITVIVTAVLVGLDTLGFNIAGLMAAGGIGGLAVGFAAKDMLANFFGGVTVFVDRPFGLGDWIVIKDNGIEGVVEDIGWRQTTIRKFDKRPVYVPNAIFTTASVENPSRMTHRRINETIGVRFDDIGAMQAITRDVRDMLRSHPEIDDSQTLMVHFDAIDASSLNFFIYCMTHTVEWTKFHEVKQDVLLKICDIIAGHGAEVAFPTRTVKIDPMAAAAGNPVDPQAGEEKT